MGKPFFERLKKYFLDVSKVLKGSADAGSVFPNASDIGDSRELLYVEFLKQHLPSKCNIYRGGFLFGENGEESKQLDIIISTDTAPRYNFHNLDEKGKSFGPVEGCLGVVSIKSTLDKKQLFDALLGIASIPETQPLGKKANPQINIYGYEDWPVKIIYASSGLQSNTIMNHLSEFYDLHPDIPISRRPNSIHVIGQYYIFRKTLKSGKVPNNNEEKDIQDKDVGKFLCLDGDMDVDALALTLNEIQKNVSVANHILFDYNGILRNLY